MNEYPLRPYQIDSIEATRSEISTGKKRVIIHLPTGAGKTVIAANIISLAVQKGSKVIFLANRRELIFQAHTTLQKHGVDASIIMAGIESNLRNPVQIASMQTYYRRLDDEKEIDPWLHEADLVVVDECHGSIAPSYKEILTRYNDKVILGLTATPCRGDGRGLGEQYDAIVNSVSVQALIDDNFLVPPRYFAPSVPDLERIRTVAGDYHRGDLAERVDQPKLVGDILENWLKHASDRKTIIFAVNVKHSRHIVEEFTHQGIKIEHVDARTPKDDRADILDRLMNGETQVISNVGILCEGFDFPAASCIVLARPTKSLGLYIQMSGRGLRPSDGKSDCIILDHGGCVANHGFLEWERDWSLNGDKLAWGERKVEKKEPQPITCEACAFVFAFAPVCPECGTPVRDYSKRVEVFEAELEELNRQEKESDERYEMARYYGMCQYYCQEKGWNPKAPAAKFKSRYGIWPNQARVGDIGPILPDVEFIMRMKYEQIRYIKSRKAKTA